MSLFDSALDVTLNGYIKELRCQFTKYTKFSNSLTMVRLPWLVIPGLAYRVMQRGNRRVQPFFENAERCES